MLWSARAITVAQSPSCTTVLGDALRASRDGDFSLRLAVRGDDEIAELKRLYNELADCCARSAPRSHQKELLLDTILQRTPIGGGARHAARPRHLLEYRRARAARGRRAPRRAAFSTSRRTLAAPLRERSRTPADAIVTVRRRRRDVPPHAAHVPPEHASSTG